MAPGVSHQCVLDRTPCRTGFDGMPGPISCGSAKTYHDQQSPRSLLVLQVVCQCGCGIHEEVNTLIGNLCNSLFVASNWDYAQYKRLYNAAISTINHTDRMPYLPKVRRVHLPSRLMIPKVKGKPRASLFSPI